MSDKMNNSKSTLKHMVETIIYKNQRDNNQFGSKNYLIDVINSLTSQVNEMNDVNILPTLYKRYVECNSNIYTTRCKDCYTQLEQLHHTFEYLKQHRSKFDEYLYKLLYEDLVGQINDTRQNLDEWQIQAACPLTFEDWIQVTSFDLLKRLKEHSEALDNINIISKLIEDESFSKTVKFLGVQ